MLVSENLEIRKSLIIQKINNMSRHSIEFHNNFVKFSTLGEIKNFNRIRLIHLNQITEVMGEFFQDDRMIQILINMLQVCFILDQEMIQFEIKVNSFEHLFYAAIFLIIKFERPSIFKKLKVKACDMKIDLDTVYVLEKLILTKISWKYNLSTAAEMKYLILSLDEKPIEEEIEGFISDLINFSLHEYGIYSKYDQLTIAAVSVLIAYNHFAKNTKFIEEAMLKLNCNFIEFDKIKEEIFYFLNKKDEQENESLPCDSGNSRAVNYNNINCKSNNTDYVSTFSDSLKDLNEICSQSSFTDGSDCFSFEKNFSEKRKKSNDMLGRKRLIKKGSSKKHGRCRAIPLSL